MISLNNLKAKPGSAKRKKRLGTGQGSGHGQTSTRGQKGQNSTSGGAKPDGFEGGQIPLLRRIPKSGFNNVQFRTEYQWVNVSSLEKCFKAGAEVNPEAMVKARLVKRVELIKVLGDGELKKGLTVKAHAFSASAREKIEKAGGKAELIVKACAAPAKPAPAKKAPKTDKK